MHVIEVAVIMLAVKFDTVKGGVVVASIDVVASDKLPSLTDHSLKKYVVSVSRPVNG